MRRFVLSIRLAFYLQNSLEQIGWQEFLLPNVIYVRLRCRLKVLRLVLTFARLVHTPNRCPVGENGPPKGPSAN